MELDSSLDRKQPVLVMFLTVLMDMTSAKVLNLSMVAAIKITPIVVAILTIAIITIAIMIEVLVLAIQNHFAASTHVTIFQSRF